MEVLLFRQRVANLIRQAQTAGSFREQVEAFVEQAKQLVQGGLTLAEVGQLFLALITLAVTGAMRLADSGPDKKAFVLDAVGELFDALAAVFPLPPWLEPVRAWVMPFLTGTLKRIVLLIADGVIEAVYAHLKPA